MDFTTQENNEEMLSNNNEISSLEQRPKLNLAPRSNNVSSSNRSSSIFGNAKPREEILKSKGIDIQSVEKKLDEKTRKVPYMNREQTQEYEVILSELAYCKEQVKNADTPEKKQQADAELITKNKEIEIFIEKVRATPVVRKERSNSGNNYNNSYYGGYNNNNNNQRYNNNQDDSAFSSFSRGNNRGYRNNNNRDNNNNNNNRTCYNCGRTGHISRNCDEPSNNGNYGGGYNNRGNNNNNNYRQDDNAFSSFQRQSNNYNKDNKDNYGY